MKIKKLSPEKIALVKAAVKWLSAEGAVDRARLKRAQLEELECHDKMSHRLIGMLERQEAGPIDTNGYSNGILYLMLAHRLIKASFLPHHKKCDAPLSKQEKTVHIIQEKARSGGYQCGRCDELVFGDDVKIELIFWRLGSETY